MQRFFAVVLFCTLVMVPWPAAAQEQRCFGETGQCIGGSIRSY